MLYYRGSSRKRPVIVRFFAASVTIEIALDLGDKTDILGAELCPITETTPHHAIPPPSDCPPALPPAAQLERSADICSVNGLPNDPM